MAKRRKKTRRKTSYASRRQQPAPAPSRPKEERPTPRPVAQTSGQRPARRPSTASRPTYARRTAAHLAAMDLEKDEVMYAYVRKDLTRIGIFSAIMFGSLLVLKLLGVG